ncbi:IS200/IS605 family accessory protein TnpB-related protein [Thermosulfurimonas sp. F29]|uniref:IS200/IS605 family accessory protein TnpB-related protein n=1 Tax=Thermosulfurimonas sp. F29 TaxID=2867247 RepID=UPI001C828FC0|nr:IS200/IS605 family accessory protein TnpB-related protein [Thermosulfurimonas sp. F29]MBX6424129.1 IS200/IS605 family accessory protein TnpB-related protein [Thermosulfurimonas sp. F29]
MITLQCRLSFESKSDQEKVLDLMRRWSACMRYGYQRLIEGRTRNELKRDLPSLFGLNTRYADDAILKAREIFSARKEAGRSVRKVVFGGRKLFEQLKRKHLNGRDRERLKRRWREARQGHLYSRGDRSKHGNLNLRFVWREGTLYLRINVGEREYVYAHVHRKVQVGRRDRDKWTAFVHDLIQAELSGRWFPYSVELKLKDGRLYALVSFEEKRPEVEITKSWGVIGLDVNASPFHLAWAEVKEDGNPVDSGRMDLSHLIGVSGGKKDLLLWETAHRVVEMARKRRRAIVMENLKKLPKGCRGDGAGKLRRRLHQFVYRKLLERIEVLARRNGIEVRKVPAAWSSVVGALKYAPQYGLDRDRAAALVIGRRGLGLWDGIPRNYRRLLSDREFLEYGILRWREKRKALNEELERESNSWKRNRIRREIKRASREIKVLQRHLESLKDPGSDPVFPQGTARGKKSPRGRAGARQKGWRVLRVAVVVPLLGKPFVRDFSPLRRILVSGAGTRATGPPAPVPGAGAAAQFTNVRFG